ncbi:uncharacterized protein TNIN_282531 [Trichonephila inaurata madagascariensis]|uniref:Uncharacterized protein n=1 Tax=Trichonephila inaurata madagascariensis TaxID=2747483 RepID=A0A8X6YEA3_9ARAC|nr:uncharacterized protein TNIN_282531 [Trichonephila inaurata madagascariensis]
MPVAWLQNCPNLQSEGSPVIFRHCLSVGPGGQPLSRLTRPLELKTSLVFFGARKQIFSLNRCVRNREYPSLLCTLEAFDGRFSAGAKSIHHWALIGVNDEDIA